LWVEHIKYGNDRWTASSVGRIAYRTSPAHHPPENEKMKAGYFYEPCLFAEALIGFRASRPQTGESYTRGGASTPLSCRYRASGYSLSCRLRRKLKSGAVIKAALFEACARLIRRKLRAAYRHAFLWLPIPLLLFDWQRSRWGVPEEFRDLVSEAGKSILRNLYLQWSVKPGIQKRILKLHPLTNLDCIQQ